MDTFPDPSDEATAGGDPAPREGVWAKPVDRLRISGLPEGALNLNVEGRHITARSRVLASCGKKPIACG